MQYLTRKQVLMRLKEACDKAGGQSALARKLDVSPAYISAVMAGKMPGPKIKALIGVERADDLWIAVQK
jgi:DNA-binding transcriptional regulator YdaS (Cro superfamily)